MRAIDGPGESVPRQLEASNIVRGRWRRSVVRVHSSFRETAEILGMTRAGWRGWRSAVRAGCTRMHWRMRCPVNNSVDRSPADSSCKTCSSGCGATPLRRGRCAPASCSRRTKAVPRTGIPHWPGRGARSGCARLSVTNANRGLGPELAGADSTVRTVDGCRGLTNVQPARPQTKSQWRAQAATEPVGAKSTTIWPTAVLNE